MKINVKKTKVMCIARKKGRGMKILIEGQIIEQVSRFKYLGSVITEDGYCRNDINSRIDQGKCAFMEKRGIVTGNMNYKNAYMDSRNICSRMLHNLQRRQEESGVI